jgi:hypothetical protein
MSHMQILAGVAHTAKRVWRGGSAPCVWVLVLASLIGFSRSTSVVAQGVENAPRNAFRAASQMPSEVRRVAVLPIAVEHPDQIMDFAQETLQPVLVAELNKRGLFELVVVTPEQLTQWTGKAHWSAAEKLPASLLEHLRDDLGCDAALFARLSQYKPYPPLAMGWNLQLVLTDHPRICWAMDEVFDMSERDVAASAQQYGRRQFEGQDLHLNPSSISLSPRQFGQYSLAESLATLPAR